MILTLPVEAGQILILRALEDTLLWGVEQLPHLCLLGPIISQLCLMQKMPYFPPLFQENQEIILPGPFLPYTSHSRTGISTTIYLQTDALIDLFKTGCCHFCYSTFIMAEISKPTTSSSLTTLEKISKLQDHAPPAPQVYYHSSQWFDATWSIPEVPHYSSFMSSTSVFLGSIHLFGRNMVDGKDFLIQIALHMVSCVDSVCSTSLQHQVFDQHLCTM